jgi:hypothetical protein
MPSLGPTRGPADNRRRAPRYHDFGAVPAVSALPHLEFEGDVLSILPCEIRDRRRNADAARPMAIVASLNILGGATHFGDLLAALDERGGRLRQRRERSVDAGIVGSHVGDILGRQRLRDRRHDGICSDTGGEVAQLLRKIVSRLAGDPRKRAAAIGTAVESMALRASRRAGCRALRDDDRPVLDIGLARRALSVREPDHTEFDGQDGRRGV